MSLLNTLQHFPWPELFNGRILNPLWQMTVRCPPLTTALNILKHSFCNEEKHGGFGKSPHTIRGTDVPGTLRDGTRYLATHDWRHTLKSRVV